jgi:tetratricopeptide (TPR) repeat protein
MKRKIHLVAAIAVLIMVTPAKARAAVNTLRGAVMAADGTMVDEFTVIVRPVLDKPELVQRKRFRNGTFRLDNLGRRKYQIIVTAPAFISVRIEVDFPKNASSTNFRLVMMHRIRNTRYFPADPINTVSVAALQQVPDAAKEHYEKGVELHREGRLVEALIEYGNALRTYPRYVPAMTDAGTIYLLLNHVDAALFSFKRAHDIDPKNCLIRLNMAAALVRKKEYGDAIKILNSVLMDSADKALPNLILAQAYFFQKKFPVAEENARLALKYDPQLLDAWLLLVNMGLENKNYTLVREGLGQLRQAMNNRAFSEFVDDEMASLGAEN